MRLAAVLAVRAAKAEELRRILPPTEDRLDPALVSLITRMRGIVAERKSPALEALMQPTFRVEFDVGKGSPAFRRHWHSQSPDSPVWEILERLLALPGHSYSDTLYAKSYVFARFPFDLDPLRHVVALKEDVDLKAEAKSGAANVGSLDHAIIPLAERMELPVVIPPGSFVALKHPVAGRCFAASSDVYHPAAHRAFFEKRQGRWRWISLAAATANDPPDLHLHRPVTG
jgi:hypothetical protein